MTAQPTNDFYREYNLSVARANGQNGGSRNPAGHQRAALAQLGSWFESPSPSPTGGMLVLPTGGGKTFTALRFLCTGPLSQGYKVLWLAHTHHLLEQALGSLERELGHIGGSASQLRARVVSGTPGHCRVHEIKPSDDVVICTLQTLTQAHQNRHPQLQAFLNAAGKKLFVVFDEAHHAPAYSYRTLIQNLRNAHDGMSLLGLTATPTYSDEQKSGWLQTLFPQKIIYQVTPKQLMAAGLLAKPIFEDHRTAFSAEFSEGDYQKWSRSYRDLPEEIISRLAESRERNLFIAQVYAENQARYGKTLIFADRWYQCEQLRAFLEERGVQGVGTVYTRVDADPGSAEARNRRDPSENGRTIERFKRGELQVLINVRMLTEGTDVPDVQTVFLTRQTTSPILLTQMIGRALRGGQFGGTDHAYIVSFIDNWKHLINWADYTIINGSTDGGPGPKSSERPPVHLVSIDLVRKLSRQMDTGVVPVEPFLTQLPVGWYRVEFTAVIEGTDDLATVQQMVMVYDNEADAYKGFIEGLRQENLSAFADPRVDRTAQEDRLLAWQQKYFPQADKLIGDDLEMNLFHIARHIAQSNGSEPAFFPFDERKHHDLDAVAQKYLDDKLSRREEHAALLAEYSRTDRYWSIIYPNLGLFKGHYNACVERLLADLSAPTAPVGLVARPEPVPQREPSEWVKEQVKERDNWCCLSCGEDWKRSLQIDHVAPSYMGGTNALDNLQTLCRVCNNHKGGINEINFRNKRTLLAGPPIQFPKLELPPIDKAHDAVEWEKFLRRSINFFYRCSAVQYVAIGKRGHYFYNWQIGLYDGNQPTWLDSFLPALLERINEQRAEARREGPDTISVEAPELVGASASFEE